MPKYRLIIPVKDVSGHQFYLVEAANEKAALAAWEAGGGDFEGEEIEVTSLGHGEEVTVEEIE